jgi:hypothetical protein
VRVAPIHPVAIELATLEPEQPLDDLLALAAEKFSPVQMAYLKSYE